MITLPVASLATYDCVYAHFIGAELYKDSETTIDISLQLRHPQNKKQATSDLKRIEGAIAKAYNRAYISQIEWQEDDLTVRFLIEAENNTELDAILKEISTILILQTA